MKIIAKWYAFFNKAELLAILGKIYSFYLALDNIERLLEFQSNNEGALLLKNDIEDYIIFGY